MDTSARQCANALLEAVPLMMRVIRAKVRSSQAPDLSVAQFRTLAFLGRNEAAMVSDVANFLALTLPAASKLMDGLVNAGLATREIDPADRRKMILTLTSAGRKKYASAVKFTSDFLAERMATLSSADLNRIARSMHVLQEVFSDEPPETKLRPAKPPQVRSAA